MIRKISASHSRLLDLLIILLCLAGIMLEIIYVLTGLFSNPQIFGRLFNLSYKYDAIIQLLINIFRMVIFFAVLYAIQKRGALYFHTWILIIIKALLCLEIYLGGLELLTNTFSSVLLMYSPDRLGYIFSSVMYLLFFVCEIVIIIRLLLISKAKIQKLFALELLAIGIFAFFIGFIRIEINIFHVILYKEFVYMALTGIIYIAGYIISMKLITDNRRDRQ